MFREGTAANEVYNQVKAIGAGCVATLPLGEYRADHWRAHLGKVSERTGWRFKTFVGTDNTINVYRVL